MGSADQKHSLDEAFERIEETILPSISLMLDTLLEAAQFAKPSKDAEIYAAELRTIALQLEALTRQVEAASPAHVDPQDYRSSSAA
jgi:hypothetical protein